jgi:tight adherence protein C
MANLLTFINSTFGSVELLLIQLMIFFSVTLGIGAVAFLISRRNSASRRLSRLVKQQDTIVAEKGKLFEKEDHGVISKVTTVFSPSTDGARKKTRVQLLQAGFKTNKSYRNFLAIKILLTFLLPLLFIIRSMFFRLTPEVLAVCLALAAFGYLLPGIVLKIMIKSRQKRISRALPDALDLMVICVEAGLGLDMTFKKVGDEIRPICSDLSYEFDLVNREVRAGRPRSESFRNLGMRTGVTEVQNLMALLTQTSRFGTSMAKALRVHADAMRIKRRQFAEERAAKTAVKLVIPLIFCIFPGIMVVLGGPAVLKIWKAIFPLLGKGS